MNQTSSNVSSWLHSPVQISLVAILIAATFILMQNSENKSSSNRQQPVLHQQTTSNHRAMPIAQALYVTDGSPQPTVAQCKFDESILWEAPVTEHSVVEATDQALKWNSNVDDRGLGVTAPLSIQPTAQPIAQPTSPAVRTAQLPAEQLLEDLDSAQGHPVNETGSWGSLSAKEIEMIESQRQKDIGLDAIEELNNLPPDNVPLDDVPADNVPLAEEFGASEWEDPLANDPQFQPEPMLEEALVEETPTVVDTQDPKFTDPSSQEMGGIGEFPELDELDDLAESTNTPTTNSPTLNEEPEFEEPEAGDLAESELPLEEQFLEDSLLRSSDPEDFGSDFIPMVDLPQDEPELTAEEKERNELKMEPLPEFKKTDEFVGVFDDPVVKIKALPDLNGKKSKHPLKPLKRNHTNPTWWANQIHRAQLPGRQPLETTLDEVIFMALRAAPQIQILNTQPQIQQAVRDEAAAGFDWSTFLNSTYNDINDPIGSTLTAGGTVNRFIQREWSFESGLRKRLRSGGDISIGQNFGTLDSNSTFLIPDNQGNSRLVLDYRQPLLQGAGPSFNTSQIALANLDLESISGDSLAELNNYLLEVVSAYWNIYFQRAMLVQNRQSVQLAQELYRQLQSREGIDVRNDQLLRAEAAVASRTSEMIRSEYELINAQDRLINLVLGAKSETVDQIELLPEQMMLPMGLYLQNEQLVQAAIRNRPEVRSAIAQIRSSAVRKQIAANQLLPRLDAVLSSYVSGLRGNRDIAGSIGDQFSTGEPSYTVGFEFEVPIGNRAAKSRFQRSQLEAQVLHRQFERQVGDVVLDARIAGREIERLNRENENNFKGLQKAALELDLIQQRQQLNLDDGKTGSLYIEDLLASQARLTAAEIRLARSQTNQAIALIDVKRATGELLSSGGQAHQSVIYEAVPFGGVVIDEPFVQPVPPVPQNYQTETQPINAAGQPFIGSATETFNQNVPNAPQFAPPRASPNDATWQGVSIIREPLPSAQLSAGQ